MTASPTLEQLLKFPCPFEIKIMGLNTPDLIAETTAIICAQAAEFDPERDIRIRPSRNGNYLALTATITASSKAQLDIIYLALNQHPLVKITL